MIVSKSELAIYKDWKPTDRSVKKHVKKMSAGSASTHNLQNDIISASTDVVRAYADVHSLQNADNSSKRADILRDTVVGFQGHSGRGTQTIIDKENSRFTKKSDLSIKVKKRAINLDDHLAQGIKITSFQPKQNISKSKLGSQTSWDKEQFT